jgi:hypothetical protein
MRGVWALLLLLPVAVQSQLMMDTIADQTLDFGAVRVFVFVLCICLCVYEHWFVCLFVCLFIHVFVVQSQLIMDTIADQTLDFGAVRTNICFDTLPP